MLVAMLIWLTALVTNGVATPLTKRDADFWYMNGRPSESKDKYFRMFGPVSRMVMSKLANRGQMNQGKVSKGNSSNIPANNEQKFWLALRQPVGSTTRSNMWVLVTDNV